jgi:hypothetical protein
VPSIDRKVLELVVSTLPPLIMLSSKLTRRNAQSVTVPVVPKF